MKIGLLAYHSAINFGASLQLLSTYFFLKNNGHNPIVINWIPEDLEVFYKKKSTNEQRAICRRFRDKYWNETERCFTTEDIAKAIENNGIEGVVIGSDAVLQAHSFIERLHFSTRSVVSMINYTSDRIFPNPFWGTFTKEIPVVMMSGSSQDSLYYFHTPLTRKRMHDCLNSYKYISVRDTWTQKMVKSITKGNIVPDITPDPVFAFNQNVRNIIPNRDEILKKYNLFSNYILVSFRDMRTVSQEWLNKFEEIALSNGYNCILLPFSDRQSKGVLHNTINLPLSPMDWYALLKYSSGYVGHNMHPIVVCIHNSIPFFSFDNYGVTRFNGLYSSDKSSKINHILNLASLQSNRVSCIAKGFVSPEPQRIFELLIKTDKKRETIFAENYYKKYCSMMNDILVALKN